MNSINTIKAGLTSITDPAGRDLTAQLLLNSVIDDGHDDRVDSLLNPMIHPGCSGQNEWTQYEHSRNRVLLGEPHQVLKPGRYGTDLMQGPVPYRPPPAPSKEGRDQSEDYRVGAQYQVVGHQRGPRVVYAVHNWFGQRVTVYASTYDLANTWRDYWQHQYEQYGQYLKGATALEEVVE